MRILTRAGHLAAAAVLILTLPVAVPAAAAGHEDRATRAREQQRALGLSLEEIDELLEDTDAELVAAYNDREIIAAQLAPVEVELAEAEEVVAAIQGELAVLEQRLLSSEEEAVGLARRIEDDSARAVTLRAGVGEVAREAYKGTLSAPALSILLEARSAEDAVTDSALAGSALRVQTYALRELAQVRGANRNRQARLTAVETKIVELKTAADAKLAEADSARKTVQARMDELETLLRDHEVKTAAIEAQRGEQLAAKATYEAQQAALAKELRAIVAAQRKEAQRKEEEKERRQAAEGGSQGGADTPARSAPPAPAGPIRPGILDFPSPMSRPVITSPYGYRIHPIFGYRKLHAGTDFRAYCGTPIIAAAAGTVQWAKAVGGFGNQVMLNHGTPNGSSLMTSYNHLTSFAVRTGEKVRQGQVVGYSGTTGTSTACHLHFEAYVEGDTVDPETLLPR